jgi:hypothetical protein
MDNFGFWITPDCLAMFDDLQRERQKTSDFRNRNRFCITLQPICPEGIREPCRILLLNTYWSL